MFYGNGYQYVSGIYLCYGGEWCFWEGKDKIDQFVEQYWKDEQFWKLFQEVVGEQCMWFYWIGIGNMYCQYGIGYLEVDFDGQ